LHGRGLEIPHSNVQQLLLQLGKLNSGIRALSSQPLQGSDESSAGSLDPPGNAVSREDKNQDQKKNSYRNLYRIGHRLTPPFLTLQTTLRPIFTTVFLTEEQKIGKTKKSLESLWPRVGLMLYNDIFRIRGMDDVEKTVSLTPFACDPSSYSGPLLA